MALESQFTRESRAFAAFTEFLTQAQEVRRLFENANMPLPTPLQRVLGETPTNGVAGRLRLHLPPLESPPRPEGASDKWVWIPLEEANVTSLLLGVLRRAGGPLASKDAVNQVAKLRPAINTGSLFNVVSRLQGKYLSRSDDGWNLLESAVAPILGDGAVWWEPGRLTKQELAAHRRIVIRHLLKASGGMQVMQIVNQLAECDFCHAPATKDLIKADMEALQEAAIVKRIGNSKKYVIAEEPHQKK